MKKYLLLISLLLCSCSNVTSSLNKIDKLYFASNLKQEDLPKPNQTISSLEEFIYSLYEGRGKSKLKSTPMEMYEALNGKIRGHHVILLGMHNSNIVFLEKQINELEKEIDILLQKERDSLELLETIPGISKISASSIIAEIGTSMDVFKTEKHISSWAGLCPKNNESAGKKKRSGIKSGNNWLRSMLCECAWSATKKKDSKFKNKYWSMVPRMGRKKALIAIANMMLRLIYHLLKTKSTYKELEIQYFIDKDKRREDRIIKELKSKGYLVEKDSLQMA